MCRRGKWVAVGLLAADDSGHFLLAGASPLQKRLFLWRVLGIRAKLDLAVPQKSKDHGHAFPRLPSVTRSAGHSYLLGIPLKLANTV